MIDFGGEIGNSSEVDSVRYYPEGFFNPELEGGYKKIPDWFIRETWLINEALDKGFKIPKEVVDYGPTRFELAAMMSASVDVTYFIEAPREWVDPCLRGEYLLDLFKSPFSQDFNYYGLRSFDGMDVADFLSQSDSSVAIALSTLDQSTAEAIRYLNQKGVPVVGWIVLDDDDGYWTNAASLEATNKKVSEIFEWRDEYSLIFDRFGIDLELPLPVVASLRQMKIYRAVREWFQYKMDVRSQSEILELSPQVRFDRILKAIEFEGYCMEYYMAPQVSQILLSSGVKPPPDSRFVDMAYSSEVPKLLFDLGLDAGKLVSPDSIPDIGIVNGVEGETPGRDFGYLLQEGKGFERQPPDIDHLDISEIERDILSVMRGRVDFSERLTLDELYVFALNAPNVVQQVVLALDRAFATASSKIELV